MTLDIFITGSGHTRFGRLEQSLEDLIVDAAREAIEEAQILPRTLMLCFWGISIPGLCRMVLPPPSFCRPTLICGSNPHRGVKMPVRLVQRRSMPG